jgi:hypothetical protein
VCEKLVETLGANLAPLDLSRYRIIHTARNSQYFRDELELLAADEEYKIFKASTLKIPYFNKYKAKAKEIEALTFQNLLYTPDTSANPIIVNTTNTTNASSNTTTNSSTTPPPRSSWTSAKNLLQSVS